MSALSANIQIDRKPGEIIAKFVAASTKIYMGALVKRNAGGYLAPCAAEAGAAFAGVAVEAMDNSAGADGDLAARVYEEGVFLLTGSGFAQSNVGDPVYATDDQTITLTAAANKQRVGIIDDFKSSTQVWVKIDVSQGSPVAAIANATDAGTAISQLNLALAVMRNRGLIQT